MLTQFYVALWTSLFATTLVRGATNVCYPRRETTFLLRPLWEWSLERGSPCFFRLQVSYVLSKHHIYISYIYTYQIPYPINGTNNMNPFPTNTNSKPNRDFNYLFTVWCHYNTVNFFQYLPLRHPIARPWGQEMGRLLGVLWFMFCISHCNAVCNIMLYWTVL